MACRITLRWRRSTPATCRTLLEGWDSTNSRRFLIETLFRFAAKRFRKAQCPIVERLCNSLMMHGRNNGEWANGHPCLLLIQWCYIYFRSPDSWCRYLFLISLFACVVLKCLLTKSLPTPYFQVRSWWPWGLWSTLSRSSISSLARTLSRQTPCSI